MKYLFLLSLIFLAFGTIFAQRITIEREYKYQASDDDGKNAAKEKATREIQSIVLREQGQIVESKQKMTTESSGDISKTNFSEEINSYTSGKLKTIVVDETESWINSIYSATFKIELDTAEFYKYLNEVLEKKQKAFDDSLKISKKKAEMEQEMENRRLKQIEQIRADSLAKERRISDLKLAVQTAKDLLKDEQEREKPLRIYKDNKKTELETYEKRKNDTQDAYNRAIKNSENTERILREAKALQEDKDKYNIASAEYNVANKDWDNANKRVEAAKNNLQNAENNLNKELNIKTSTTSSKELKTTYEVRSKIYGEGKIQLKAADRFYDVSGKGLTVNGGKYRFFFEPKSKRWDLVYVEINNRIFTELIEGKHSALINIDSDKTIYANFHKIEKTVKEKKYNFDKKKFWGWTSIIVGGLALGGGIAMLVVGGEEIPYNPYTYNNPYPSGSQDYQLYEAFYAIYNTTEVRSDGLLTGGILATVGSMGLTVLGFCLAF